MRAILESSLPLSSGPFINSFIIICVSILSGSQDGLLLLRPRLDGTGRIWDRAEFLPFLPVYTRIRPAKGVSKSWFSCKRKAETDESVQPGS